MNRVLSADPAVCRRSCGTMSGKPALTLPRPSNRARQLSFCTRRSRGVTNSGAAASRFRLGIATTETGTDTELGRPLSGFTIHNRHFSARARTGYVQAAALPPASPWWSPTATPSPRRDGRQPRAERPARVSRTTQAWSRFGAASPHCQVGRNLTCRLGDRHRAAERCERLRPGRMRRRHSHQDAVDRPGEGHGGRPCLHLVRQHVRSGDVAPPLAGVHGAGPGRVPAALRESLFPRSHRSSSSPTFTSAARLAGPLVRSSASCASASLLVRNAFDGCPGSVTRYLSPRPWRLVGVLSRSTTER